jgi:hypothetical protein
MFQITAVGVVYLISIPWILITPHLLVRFLVSRIPKTVALLITVLFLVASCYLHHRIIDRVKPPKRSEANITASIRGTLLTVSVSCIDIDDKQGAQRSAIQNSIGAPKSTLQRDAREACQANSWIVAGLQLSRW